jgi:hypothetical protein
MSADFHAELLSPDAAYAPLGKTGPQLNARQVHQLQQTLAAHTPQPTAPQPQVARLVAALLASRSGAQR